jgi:hypothetical protein
VPATRRQISARLQAAPRWPAISRPVRTADRERDPHAYAEFGFSIDPAQGDLIYLLCRLLCRALGTTHRRVRDLARHVHALLRRSNRRQRRRRCHRFRAGSREGRKCRRNLAEAGIADFVDIRQGGARETLRDLGGPVDFVLIDGWPGGKGPSLARQVMEIAAPRSELGLVMNDNGEQDYLAYVRDPANGFRSMSLPLKGATELSVKVS